MSVKLGATFTVVDPITVGGKPIEPGEHVVYDGTVFVPERTAEWELPPIENKEGAPTRNMSYGFSFGGVTNQEIKDWKWTINGEQHDPRPENLVPIEGGGLHYIVITVVLVDSVGDGRKFTLTAAITVAS